MSLVPSCSFTLLVAPILLPTFLSQVAAAPLPRSDAPRGTNDIEAAAEQRHFPLTSASMYHRSIPRGRRHRRFRKRQDSDPGPSNFKKSERIMGTIDIVLPREDEDDPEWMASLRVDCSTDTCTFDITHEKPTPVFLVSAPNDGFKFAATAEGRVFQPVLLEVPSNRLKSKGKGEAGVTPQCVTYHMGKSRQASSKMTIEPCAGSQPSGVKVAAADTVKSQIFAYDKFNKIIRPFWLAGIQAQDDSKPKPADLDDRAIATEAQHAAMRFSPSAQEELAARQDAAVPDPSPATSTVTSMTTITVIEGATSPAPAPVEKTPVISSKSTTSNTVTLTPTPQAAGEETSPDPVPTSTTTAPAGPAVSPIAEAGPSASPSLPAPPAPVLPVPPTPAAAPMNATEVAEGIVTEAEVEEEVQEEGDEQIVTLGNQTTSAAPKAVQAQSSNPRVAFPESVETQSKSHSSKTDSSQGSKAGKAEVTGEEPADENVMIPLDTEPYTWKFEAFGEDSL